MFAYHVCGNVHERKFRKLPAELKLGILIIKNACVLDFYIRYSMCISTALHSIASYLSIKRIL